MEVSLDELIEKVNSSQKTVVNYYLFAEMGVGATELELEGVHLKRDEDGYACIPFMGEDQDNAYYLNDNNEIYQEEPDQNARAKFEIRDGGMLLMEIYLY
ncbi:MAG: hypothetical protein GX119_07920 [Syntrophomonadaceae bacterium]|nr:hypothetical protein [Syntrophomonadaceae bacterium]